MSQGIIIEICHLPTKEGVSADSAMQKIGKLFTAFPGVISQYWGKQLEHPDTLDLVVEWEKLEDHKAYLTSDTFKSVMEIVPTIMDPTRPFLMYHVPSTVADANKVLNAPVVEIMRFTNLPSTFDEKIIPLVPEVLKTAEVQGLFVGYVVEEVNGKEYAAGVGWDSVEAHTQKATQGELGKKWERISEHAGQIDSHHVVLTKYEK